MIEFQNIAFVVEAGMGKVIAIGCLHFNMDVNLFLVIGVFKLAVE
jgi:hypothetical protein